MNINSDILVFSHIVSSLWNKESKRNCKTVLFRDTLFSIIYNFLQEQIHIWKIKALNSNNDVALKFSRVTQAKRCWNVTISLKCKYKATHHNKYWSVIKKNLVIKTSFLDGKQQLAHEGVFRTQSKLYSGAF